MKTPDIRASEILKRLPDGPLRGAEIGVFKGQLSALLLHGRPQMLLYLVDSWAPTQEQPRAYIDCGDFHALLPAEKQERCYRETLTAVRFALDRAVILRMNSVQAAARVDDGSLDFVFIDADHSYEGCRADIEAWTPKVKPGGYLCGHDYDHPIKTGFGVKRAVDEAVERHGWALVTGDDLTWFVRP
jgi:hypothetical protein